MACVLIVEDNPLNLELAQDILEAQGFEVRAAHDAAQCFAALADRRPDLILMDIQLPGKDGLQITRELRANPATRDLPIVAMTAHAMVEDARLVAEAGCDGYLTKPIQTRTLAPQVAAFLASKGQGTQECYGGEQSRPFTTT
jgi:CheY-like chemotaxis protein